MRLIFIPEKLYGYVSLLGIMTKLRSYGELGCSIINDIVYDNKFSECLLSTLGELHPDLDFVANSFIQEDVVKTLSNVDVYIFAKDCNIGKYQTGNLYLPMYKQLKKFGFKNLHLNEDIQISYSISEDEILRDTIIIWKETHMGEITDAISKAISDMSIGNEKTNDDRIKQAMANIGMPVENYSKRESDKDESSFKEFMNKPQEDELSCDEETHEVETDTEDDEICFKVSNGKMVIMIPRGTKMNEVTVNGVVFDTVTTKVPDINHSGMQILSVLNAVSEEKKPNIVRVPIFLSKEDKEVKSESNDSITCSDYESLKAEKERLDVEIKKARKDGNDDLVGELRKQRRKVRSELNKLEV